MSLKEIKLDNDIRLFEEPKEIIDRKTQKLYREIIDLVLVNLKHSFVSLHTVEVETEMKACYSHLFKESTILMIESS